MCDNRHELNPTRIFEGNYYEQPIFNYIDKMQNLQIINKSSVILGNRQMKFDFEFGFSYWLLGWILKQFQNLSFNRAMTFMGSM